MASSSSIFRGNIKKCNGRISPASIHGCRVAIKDDKQFFVANENEVYLLKPTFPEPNERDASALSKTGLPVPITITEMSEEVLHTPHRHEIQSILYDEPNNNANEGRLGCIDRYGCASITTLTNQPKSIILPPAHTSSDDGWAGLSFDPKNSNIVATAHLPSKAIALYDLQAPGGPKVTKCTYGLNSPTFIQLLEDGTMLTLEYNQLAVYDMRSAVSCVKRVISSTTWLYPHIKFNHSDSSIILTRVRYGLGIGAAKSGNVVAVGGASRTLTVYDMRKWAICASWSNCLKHSIRSVHFSKVHADLCYVGGIDAEVIVGKWEGGGNASHFTCLRVDARWVGLHADPSRDLLFGATASGSPYFVRDPAHMYDRAKDTQAALATHPHPTSFDEGMDVSGEGSTTHKRAKAADTE